MNGRQNPHQNPASRQNPRQPQRKKKKFYFKPNKEGMQALLILVVIAALLITLLVLTIKGIANAVGGPEETTTEETTTAVTTTEAPVVATWHDDYVKKAVPTTDVAVGDLILVNFENKYELTDTITPKLKKLYASEGCFEYFQVSGSDLQVRREIAENLRIMITDLVDASPTLGTTKAHDQVIIVSGYRSTDYQQGLYEKQVEDNYVALPGHSEHHTGLAVDIKSFLAADAKGNRATTELSDDDHAWLEANCANYGFVVRYDGAKFELTGILDETWHFRYVGKPHAQYMSENGLCLEEYLSLLRTTYNFDTCDAPLTYITGEGEEATTYEIYYYPASADVNTDIFVPKAGTYSNISISGDNMNGFIVTVTK
jgi:LAS superfamily LD-carboxypeptidase LdcB